MIVEQVILNAPVDRRRQLRTNEEIGLDPIPHWTSYFIEESEKQLELPLMKPKKAVVFECPTNWDELE